MSSKTIQIWHTLKGASNDATINANASGTATCKQKFASAGTCTDDATFAGDT